MNIDPNSETHLTFQYFTTANNRYMKNERIYNIFVGIYIKFHTG